MQVELHAVKLKGRRLQAIQSGRRSECTRGGRDRGRGRGGGRRRGRGTAVIGANPEGFFYYDKTCLTCGLSTS